MKQAYYISLLTFYLIHSPFKCKAACDELIPGKCAPYFALIGAMKCGTNALSEYILQQSHIKLNPYREFHYFSDGFCPSEYYMGSFSEDKNSINANSTILQVYANSFEDTDWENTFTFDKSPGYMQETDIIPIRIKRLIPNIRVVALLCDPVDRFFSQYHHLRRHGLLGQNQNLTFREYTDWALEDPARGISAGFYIDLLKYYFQWLGPDHVYILDSSRLFSEPEKALSELLRFLKIPVKEKWESKKFVPVYRNPNKIGLYAPKLERQKLVKVYRSSVDQLSRIANFNHSWKNFL